MTATKLYNLQKHSYEYVPDEQLDQSLRSGVFRLPAGQTIRAYDPEGNPYEVDNRTNISALPDFRFEKNVERVERNKMAEAAERPITAALAGGLRGASFGISDALGSALGVGEDLRRLKEANPTASMIGEIGGTIGSMALLPGGGLVGGAARVGEAAAGTAERVLAGTVLKGTAEAATSTLAKDIALRAAQGAITKGAGGFVEGALYGVGQTLSEASLGDPKEAAEHLISNVGFAGLLNGTLMGVGGAFGGILRNANGPLSKAEAEAIRSRVDNLRGAAGEIDKNLAEEIGKTAEKLINENKITDPSIIEKIRSGISSGADISDLMLGALTGAEVSGPVDKLASKYVDLVAKTRGLDEETVKTLKEVAVDPKMRKTVLDYLDNAPEAMSQLGRNFEHVAQVAENASQAFALDTRRASINSMPAQYANNIKLGQKIAQEADSSVMKTIKEISSHRDFYDQAGLREVMGPLREFQANMQTFTDNKDVLNGLIDLKRGIGKALAPYRDMIERKVAENATYKELSSLYGKLSDLTHTEAAFSPQVVSENKAINKAVNEFLNVQEEMQRKFYTQRYINGQKVYQPDPDKFFKFIRSDEARQMLKNDIFEAWVDKTANLLRTAQGMGIENEMFQNAGAIVDGFIKSTAELRQTKAAALAVSALESHTGKSLQRMMYGTVIGSMGGPILGGIGAGLGYAIDNPVQVLRLLNRAQEGIVSSKKTMAGLVDKFAGIGPKGLEEIGEAATTKGASIETKGGLTVPKTIRLGIVQGFEDDERKPVTLEQVLSNPTEDTVTRVLERHGELNSVMPAVQSQIGAQTAAAVEFLKSKMPQDPNTQYQLFPTKQPYVLPDSIRTRFERYVDAINDPMATLKHMADGKLTAEHVEALQAVYPSIYAEAQRTVMEVLSQKNVLTFKQKVQLGLFMQAPTMPAFDPTVFASIQSQYAIAEAEEKATKVPQTLGQNLKTSFDRAATR